MFYSLSYLNSVWLNNFIQCIELDNNVCQIRCQYYQSKYLHHIIQSYSAVFFLLNRPFALPAFAFNFDSFDAAVDYRLKSSEFEFIPTPQKSSGRGPNRVNIFILKPYKLAYLI